MIGVNLPELVGNGAWLDGRAARVEGAALHDPEDDNLANADPVRTELLPEQADELVLRRHAIMLRCAPKTPIAPTTLPSINSLV
ncbi:MAG TPA: hypothetical protein VEI57_02640 [Nitrospirota bacterium]|nr:hypothetical protein [Nitrospirota bacterium]